MNGGIFEWDYWGYRSAFALIIWIPISLYMFTRERPTRAATHVLLWGMMWLPEAAAFDFPALPPLSKYSISAICALVGLYWKSRSRLRAARFGRGYDIIVFILILAEIGTVITNQDPLRYGSWKTVDLPAFTAYDGLSAAVRDFLEVCIPFLLGRALIRTRRDLVDVLSICVVAGLIYSLPIFWELRMSPMLHQNVYGFQSRTDWLQNLRGGGYRPTVFMGHGLVVGFFMFICTTAAVTLHRAGKRELWGIPLGYVVLFMFGVLLVEKAAAALIYGAVGYVLIRWLGVKNQMRVLMVLALIVVSYPISRVTNVFPTQALLSAAGTMGKDRAESLQFRFDNEDILVAKGSERPLFGWGGFSRERVYDAETGKDIVVQDGYWIALFGTHGTVGFVCFFALLLWPIYQAARNMKRITSRSDRTLLAGLGFIVAVCAVNMLPNMSLPNLPLFFAAGLATLIKELPKQAAQEAHDAQQAALAGGGERDGQHGDPRGGPPSTGPGPRSSGLRHTG
jgi:hypothetical protein